MMKRVTIVERRILAGIIYPWKAVCGESRMHGLGWGEVIYVNSDLSAYFDGRDVAVVKLGN